MQTPTFLKSGKRFGIAPQRLIWLPRRRGSRSNFGLMAMLAAVAKASAIHFTPTTSASWINQVERH